MVFLRNVKLLARLVLVWFALSVAVAVASPLAKTQTLELICSGAGMLTLQPSSDEGGTAVSIMLDCPLCASWSAPPPDSNSGIQSSLALAQRLPFTSAQPGMEQSAAPWQARGPPSSL